MSYQKGGVVKLLKVREIADKCSVNRNQIYRFIKSESIEPVKIVGNVRYYSDDLIKMFNEFKHANNSSISQKEDRCLNLKQQNEQKFLNEKIEFLKRENDFLKKQINEQNSQIKELHTLLHENNQALLENKGSGKQHVNIDKIVNKHYQTEGQTEFKRAQTERKDNNRKRFFNRILKKLRKEK